MPDFKNPFKPGAGHTPPYLAGRDAERDEFARLLAQDTILENLVLTGLRGVGKTVLLESLKPLAIEERWLWVGTDLSESTSVSEGSMAKRICADLSLVTSNVVVGRHEETLPGFEGERRVHEVRLNYDTLAGIYAETPGLSADKLKAVLHRVWSALSQYTDVRGIVFAYDEAQTLSDQASKEEFPLSLLLDVFQSIQRAGLPMMLVLTGLPTLFPKLVEARTFSERMFRVVYLKSLSASESRDAILKPIADANCPVRLGEPAVDEIVDMSGGYPYFIQFVCREVYDAFLQRTGGDAIPEVPRSEIERKLDSDFFAGRWARATDRQRDLLSIIASLEHCDDEFTVQDIVERSKSADAKPFSSSHANQMLATLSEQGLVFKNRHGRYSFAVPLLSRFIRRQASQAGVE
jgi:hypothetical protein